MPFERLSALPVPSTIAGIHLAADGRSLAASFVSMADGRNAVWVVDTRSGRVSSSFAPQFSLGAVLSPDGEKLWFQTHHAEAVATFCAHTSTPSSPPTLLTERSIGFTSLIANKDCSLMAAVGSNIEVWATVEEQPIRYIRGNGDGPITCAFSTDSKHLYVAQSYVLEKQVLVTGEVVDQWEIPGGYPGTISISRTGRFLAFAGTTQSVLFDGHQPLYTELPRRLTHTVSPLLFLPDESGVVRYSGGGPRIYALGGPEGIIERGPSDRKGPVEYSVKAADAEVYAWVVETRDEGYFIVVYERV